MNEILRSLEQEQLKNEVPNFGPGDTVKVHVKIVEGKRERIQVFEGVVLKRQGGGIKETFTVRKISFNVGVERTFPVHSPRIDKIEVTRKGKVRRAKLNYLRGRVGKAAKIKEARVGVERTFPVHSPRIDKIEVTRKGKVRRAKLNYLRGRVGKAAKIKEAR